MKYLIGSIIVAIAAGLSALTPCQALDRDAAESTNDKQPVLTTGQASFLQFNQKFQIDFQSLTTASDFAKQTYNAVYESLINYSHKIEILPTATDQFYDAEAMSYQYIALPLVALPHDNVRFEVFSQAYDPSYYALSHRSQDDPLNSYMPYADLQFNDAKFAVGVGASLPLDDRSSLRALYTSGTIPGLGDSKLGLSYELKF
ncbi:hypothetical protein GCM10011369_09520 [Neiella marina]|uniref:Uncharacterized protein n=1 Tax=Neiella marina TaxID=508461 RepID=A0A8J2U3D1_9GAMM|nr:hypothetical protein [Neiella marina]GGA69950.1 hypothetical protein GCM10011369_09520 [Neiella marina]